MDVWAGNRATLTSGTNFALANTISQFSRLSWTYKPAIKVEGVGNSIRHNLIHDGPHSAVLLYGNKHIFEYNEIHHVCTDTADAGAVYMGRDWTFRGNIFRYNYFHDIEMGPGVIDTTATGVNGLYLDDLTSGCTVVGNLFYSCRGAMVIGGGRDNIVNNNMFLKCTDYSIYADERALGYAADWITNAGSVLWTALNAMPYRVPPWVLNIRRWSALRQTIRVPL